MSDLKKMAKRIRVLHRDLEWKLADEALPLVIEELKASYPSEHVRTGRARDSIEGKARGSKLRLKAGARKKKSKSGKRRKSRTGKVNYGQFLPYLLDDPEAIDRAMIKAAEKLDAL